MEEHQMPTNPGKKLGQLLHEEQEPFILEVYLHSKGCLKKTFNPEIRLSSAGHAHSGKFLKISTSKKGVSYCSKIIKAVFNKLNFVHVRLRKKHGRFGATENEEVDTFALVCQHKQFSPVLVLEETQSPELSASLREQLLSKSPTNQAPNDDEDVVGFNLHTQKLKSKRELQQRRQLLFDCIKEALETTKKRHCLKELFGAEEELQKFICAKIKCWGKQCGNESSITQLLQFDYTDSAQEWGEHGSHRREIAVKISDDILEDLKSELVRSMF